MKNGTTNHYNIEVPTLEGQLKDEGFKKVAELEARADGKVELPIDLVPKIKGRRNIFVKPYTELIVVNAREINSFEKSDRKYIVYQKREESPYVFEQYIF